MKERNVHLGGTIQPKENVYAPQQSIKGLHSSFNQPQSPYASPIQKVLFE